MLLSLLLLVTAAAAAPAPAAFKFVDELPLLELPYATYRANNYDAEGDIYNFKNIRFAAPPLRDLRWAKPAPPVKQEGIQNGTVGNQCPQGAPGGLADAVWILEGLEPVSEDCLFLDVAVPGKVIRGEKKNLPVLMWIFGGGYVLGSKSFFWYDHRPILKSADNDVIWVAPNYRLGSFGWMGGPTVEKHGLANAALWDQHAALQWVQDYISLLGGDPGTVTAMGESAGAGSIMHHLVADGGTKDPLFHRAIMMSPAWEPMYSPPSLEDSFLRFAKAAGCEGQTQDLKCLRSKDTMILRNASQAVTSAAQYGTFGWGPTVDNGLIADLPGMEMGRGRYWKNVDVIVGHAASEGAIFADPSVETNEQVDALIAQNYPDMTQENVEYMRTLYPNPSIFGPYWNNNQRLVAQIGDWVVNCNARWVAQAYASRAYAYRFSVPPGIHGLDIFTLFMRTDMTLIDILEEIFGKSAGVDLKRVAETAKDLVTGFRSYFTSFAKSGNPNTFRQKDSVPPTVEMPKATVADMVKSTVDVGLLAFTVLDDNNTMKKQCDFWQSDKWTGR